MVFFSIYWRRFELSNTKWIFVQASWVLGIDDSTSRLNAKRGHRSQCERDLKIYRTEESVLIRQKFM